MSTITTHVLDTSLGRPAAGIGVTLARLESGEFETLVHATTDADGRAKSLAVDEPLGAGVYRLSFETSAYFQATRRESFYERVEIQFRISASEHYHVPLLLSPYGYSTYRGS